jgi:hypothetical protein
LPWLVIRSCSLYSCYADLFSLLYPLSTFPTYYASTCSVWRVLRVSSLQIKSQTICRREFTIPTVELAICPYNQLARAYLGPNPSPVVKSSSHARPLGYRAYGYKLEPHRTTTSSSAPSNERSSILPRTRRAPSIVDVPLHKASHTLLQIPT